MVEIKAKDLNIEKIAESGQCFRFTKDTDGSFRLIALDKMLRILPQEDCVLFDCSQKDLDEYWYDYFDLGTNYETYRNAIPKDDEYLKEAAKYGEGIRILRQDPWEMLISFIISQRNSIPSIRNSIEKLCKLCGENFGDYYAFPGPDELAGCSDEDLKACSLGYRVPYIKKAALEISSGEVDLHDFNSLSDADLMTELLKFYGVGVKVANCVSLFGYHRIAAFPIDVWIKRVLDEHYRNGFPFEKYEGFAGIIQQYMFFYARSTGKKY